MSQDRKNNIPLDSSGMEIPDYAIERMAKCLLPIIRSQFESQKKCKEPDGVENEDVRLRPAA